MTLLVAGGAGYIGSHVVRILKKHGYDVVVFDSLINGHKKALPKNVPLVKADLSQSHIIEKALKKYNIKAVLHFAAFISVPESVTNPELYYRNNVVNTLNLLSAMRKSNVKKIVFSSSAAVYGEPAKVPVTEDLPTVPKNPYGQTKLMMEQMLRAYDTAYNMKSVCLRYFNAAGADLSAEIGEAHNPEAHLIPLVLRAALASKPIKIFGTDYPTRDGTCIRDYIHVTDLAEAHVLAVKHLLNGKNSSIFNLGNEKGFSVKEIITISEEITGKKIQKLEQARRAGDPATLVASSRKIRKELHWKPKCSDIKTIIGSAWQWHKGHPKGYSE